MLRIGMIGSGYIASVHAKTIHAHPDLELAAVFSRSEARCVEFCAVHGGRPVATISELLSNCPLDAIIIASPTDTHADYLQAASATDKPIYCEKPVDLSFDKCRMIVSELTAKKTRVMMGFNRRFEPDYTDLHQTVASGRLGTLQTVQMISRGPQVLAPIDYLRQSGGFFRDKGIHFFDLTRHMACAEPVSVFAAGRAVHPTVSSLGDVDTVIITLEMTSGALCMIENARLSSYGYDEKIEIFGTDGMAETRRQLSADDQSFPQSNFEKLHRSFTHAMDAFARWIVDPAVTVPDLQDGLKAQAIAEAAVISLSEKRVVTLDEIGV